MVVIGILLLGEYAIISLAFRAYDVAVARGGAWASLRAVGAFGHWGLLAATTVLVLRPPNEATLRRAGGRKRLGWVLSHCLSFVLFFALNAQMFGRPEAPPGPVTMWFAGWLLSGAATILTLAAAFFDVGRVSAHRVLRGMLVGAVVALLLLFLGTASRGLWQWGSRCTLNSVGLILQPFFSDLFVDAPGLRIGLRHFIVEVAPGCSGFEGIGLISALMAAYIVAFRARLRFPAAFGLVPLGVLFVWWGNVLRIALLVVIGSRWDREIALGAFHSKAGWVLFCGVALGVAHLGGRMPIFSKEADDGARLTNTTVPYIVPLMTVAGTALLLSALSSDRGVTDSLRAFAGVVALFAYRNEYRALRESPKFSSLLVGALSGVAWACTTRATLATGHDPTAWSFATIPRVLGFVIITPVCEELAFRGYLPRRLTSANFLAVAPRELAPWTILLSAILFGALHERWIAATVCGIAYGLILVRSGRLSDAVVAHAATNAVLASWWLVTGNEAVWG